MHVGVIPDGNRRYASNHGIEKMDAYEKARETIRDVTDSLNGVSEDIDSISFYLLSEENLSRTKDELETLFHLLEENIESMADFFDEKNYSVNWASTEPEALPERLREKLRDIEERYSDGDTEVNLLISYSGKQDILKAGKKTAENSQVFSEENFSDHLQISHDIDFVIRTGDNPDRECISGFPIWNSSYAEFYHIKKNFPAIEPEDVEKAFDHYRSLRKKRGE
ncbi:MAG: undecaprenyl diphosphate synthase family protein [Candidatus Nanosalina sp.]